MNKTCLMRFWRPKNSHEPQPNVLSATCHSAQTHPFHPSTQPLYSRALRAQTRPALRPRPSLWLERSALKQTHPPRFNGEQHLDIYWRSTCSHVNIVHQITNRKTRQLRSLPLARHVHMEMMSSEETFLKEKKLKLNTQDSKLQCK